MSRNVSRETEIKMDFAWGEIMMAAQVGIMRRTSAVFKKRNGMYGANQHGRHWWGIDIEAALAEMAVSRFCNLSWEGAIGRTDAIDVGGMVQVRSIEHAHHRLMLHREDNDNHPFVLARVCPPSVFLVGWCFAYEGKVESFWETQTDKHTGESRQAYFVPTHRLRSMPDLLEELRDRQSVVLEAAE